MSNDLYENEYVLLIPTWLDMIEWIALLWLVDDLLPYYTN